LAPVDDPLSHTALRLPPLAARQTCGLGTHSNRAVICACCAAARGLAVIICPSATMCPARLFPVERGIVLLNGSCFENTDTVGCAQSTRAGWYSEACAGSLAGR
jgi:hypothetical protein